MGVLTDHHIRGVYHFAPLHYLAFIARANSLLSKPELLRHGFPQTHLRSMSSKQDASRGFSAYVHLTLDTHPPILRSKLAAGFPHIQLTLKPEKVEATDYCLCRYNIAMTRYLRRGTKPGFQASATNGRYYGRLAIPVAKTESDKSAMLTAHEGRGTMIEVLVARKIQLPADTTVTCYSLADATIARRVLDALESPWRVASITSPTPYPRVARYSAQVSTFLECAVSDPSWKGNGLEFDRV